MKLPLEVKRFFDSLMPSEPNIWDNAIVLSCIEFDPLKMISKIEEIVATLSIKGCGGFVAITVNSCFIPILQKLKDCDNNSYFFNLKRYGMFDGYHSNAIVGVLNNSWAVVINDNIPPSKIAIVMGESNNLNCATIKVFNIKDED